MLFFFKDDLTFKSGKVICKRNGVYDISFAQEVLDGDYDDTYCVITVPGQDPILTTWDKVAGVTRPISNYLVIAVLNGALWDEMIYTDNFDEAVEAANELLEKYMKQINRHEEFLQMKGCGMDWGFADADNPAWCLYRDANWGTVIIEQ